jgi:hypothetical protein
MTNKETNVRAMFAVFIDRKAFAEESGEPLTPELLNEIGQRINDEITASFHGVESWYVWHPESPPRGRGPGK